MNTAPLLAELEPLTHHARVRRMLEVGRLPATEREPLLDSLAEGAAYERRLVAFACHGSRDASRAYQAALDPSGHVHGLATSLVARLCSDRQLLDLLRELPTSRHRRLLNAWHKARRSSAPVDTWVEHLLAEGQRQEAWAALPYASPALAQRLFPQVLDEGGWAGDPAWERAARRHPEVAGQELLRRARVSTEMHPQLTWQVNTALPTLAEKVPDLALDLAREIERTSPLGHLNLQPLIRVRPEGVARLLLDSRDAPSPHLTLTPRLRRLSPDITEALLRRRSGVLPGAEHVYRTLPAEVRQRLSPAFLTTFTTSVGLVPPQIVRSLPAALRIQEARRHLQLPFLQTRIGRKLEYAAFLPWEEAHAVLNAFLRSPDAELRAQALSSLVFCVRYERARQAELLALMTARRNEQDPVRLAMLQALAALPPGLWQEASLTALGQVIQDALNAADLSHGTASAAKALVVGLLPFFPEWSADRLAQLVQARGQVNLGLLEHRLTRETAGPVIATLLPVLRSWETREREAQLLQALGSLGRYVAESEDLLDLLEERTWHSKTTWVSTQALGLLQAHQRERFAALVPRLLQKDPSWGTQPVVYGHLHRTRQDLLTPFLGRQAFSGRFSTGQTRFVLPFTSGFTRWTLEQQRVFAETLTELSRDGQRDTLGVWAAMNQLAALPSPVPRQPRPSLLARVTGQGVPDRPLARLTALADLRNTNLALRDRAIRALGRLDEGRGAPALLEALGDDRARIAIYTLRRPLLELRPGQALDLLLQVPRERVTVLKEVVRLTGDLPGEAAYRALLTFSTQDLHRDVRVALLRALWNHLNRAESWPILLAAARSNDAALSDGLVRMPGQALTGEGQERYLELLQALLTHPDPVVRLETLRFHQPVTDPRRHLLGTLLGSLASVHAEETVAAAQVIFASYSARDAASIGEAFGRLLPDRRALRSATRALQTAAAGARQKAAPVVEAVLAALLADPLTVRLQVDLGVATLDWDDLAVRLMDWSQREGWHAEVLMGGVAALRSAQHRPDAADVERLEQALTGGNEQARRLALEALILAAEVAGGWMPERLQRLQAFRADSAPLVASAAQFTLPDQERGGA